MAAQALIAGIRTVTEDRLHVHSLHSYFLRPGDTAVPIIYDVERLRDGRSFATRRIVARQHGHAIYFMTANFQRAEDGFEHQDAMPEVSGGPHAGIEFAELAKGRGQIVGELRPGVGGSRRPLPRQLRPQPHRRPVAAGPRPAVDPRQRPAGRRPGRPPRHVHLRQRHDAARRHPRRPRRHHRRPAPPAGLAGPLDLVPPAVPRRRVVALRPVVAVGLRAPAASRWRGCSPRTAPSSPRWPRRASSGMRG